jgi:hypothetical protein
MYDDNYILPWFEHVQGLIPGLALFDVHAHTGWNDPDGFKLSAEELLETLKAVSARSVVMPMHEPGGYPPANDRIIAECEASGGRLVPFCRLNPHCDPVAEARRCVAAGARGIKLHPRAEAFDLGGHSVAEIFGFADEQQLPVLIHAGRGIPTLGRDAVALARRYQGSRVILAHAAICDLNWIWREAAEVPNLYFDTSWWHPVDLATLFTLIPPGQILYGSDPPYFTPALVATSCIYAGLQLGLDHEQLRMVLGGQLDRLIAGEEPADLGPPLGPSSQPQSILLERVTSMLILAVGRLLLGDSAHEPLSLARLACDVGSEDAPEAAVCRNILKLLDRQELAMRGGGRRGVMGYAGAEIVMLAANVSRAPSVSLPEVPELATEADIRRSSLSGHFMIDPAMLSPRALEMRRASGVMPAITPGTKPPEPDEIERDLRRSSAADHMLIDPGQLPPPGSP